MIPIDEVIIFDVATHVPTTGAVSDADSAPTFDVFEEDTDTPILSAQTMTKRTSKTGDYRGSITCSAANGFEAGKWYSVVVSATVSSVTAKCVAKHFRIAPAESVAGVPKVDPSTWDGTDITTGVPLAPTVAGRTLDVSATGEAGIDWSNLGSPTTTNNLSGTTVKTLTDAPSDSSGVTTLLSRLSGTRAVYLDNLSAGAVGLESTLATIASYIDTEVAAIKAKTDLIPGTQDGYTFAQLHLLMAAVLLGKASGLDTTTAIYRAVNDSKDRVTATVDSDGNRTAVTLDAS